MHKNATIDRTNVLSIGRTKQKTNFVSSFFYLLHFLDIVLRFELNAQFRSIEPERHTKQKYVRCAQKTWSRPSLSAGICAFFSILRSNKEKYAQKGTKQSHFCYFFLPLWCEQVCMRTMCKIPKFSTYAFSLAINACACICMWLAFFSFVAVQSILTCTWKTDMK